MVALASAAGIAERFLDAREPHERVPLEAVALEAEKHREEEAEMLARLIRREIGRLIDGSAAS